MGRAPSSQPRRAPLSLERVLGAAISLADAEGLAALTMRRVAAEVGVEPMSLYHYLPSKEVLLDEVVAAVLEEVEAAIGRLGTPDQEGDWRAAVRRQFLAARTVMLRHPWAPALLGSRRTVPPGVYLYYDRIVATLLGAGFSHRLAHRALHAFGSMPLGFVQEMFSPASAGGSTDVDTAEADFAAMAAALPHLTGMLAAEAHDLNDPALGWCDSQVEFEFTIDLLLDGLDRLRGT